MGGCVKSFGPFDNSATTSGLAPPVPILTRWARYPTDLHSRCSTTILVMPDAIKDLVISTLWDLPKLHW